MIKKLFALLLCLIFVISFTGTFEAIDSEEKQRQQQLFSVVEKNLITGEESIKTLSEDDVESFWLFEFFYYRCK